MKHLSKKSLNTFIVLLVAATLLSLSVYAWFYFPTSQNVNLATADKKDLQIRLYKMDLDGLNYRFIEEPVGSSSVINLSHTWSFFQWGYEYLIENEEEQLFALECICDTDIFESGKIKLVLDFDMVCTSDNINEPINEAEPYYALLNFVEISYHIIDLDITSYDITSQAASVQAQNMTQSDFTTISLTESGSTSEALSLEGDVNYTYVDRYENNDLVNYYTQTVGVPPNTTERFRSVIIIKIKANQDVVTDAMNDYSNDPRAVGFDYLAELDLINELTLTCTLRTVPAKTE